MTNALACTCPYLDPPQHTYHHHYCHHRTTPTPPLRNMNRKAWWATSSLRRPPSILVLSGAVHDFQSRMWNKRCTCTVARMIKCRTSVRVMNRVMMRTTSSGSNSQSSSRKARANSPNSWSRHFRQAVEMSVAWAQHALQPMRSTLQHSLICKGAAILQTQTYKRL